MKQLILEKRLIKRASWLEDELKEYDAKLKENGVVFSTKSFSSAFDYLIKVYQLPTGFIVEIDEFTDNELLKKDIRSNAEGHENSPPLVWKYPDFIEMCEHCLQHLGVDFREFLTEQNRLTAFFKRTGE